MAAAAAAAPAGLPQGEVQPAGGAALRPNPYSHKAVQADLASDVMASGRDAPRHGNAAEDEASAFTQFARTQEHLATSPASPTPSVPTTGPASGEQQHAPKAAPRGGGGGGGPRPWWSVFACGCGAPPKDAAKGSMELPSRRELRSGTAAPGSMRPRRTLSKQVSLYAGSRRTFSAVKSTYSDAQWFDALSRFDSTDFSSALHDDVDAMLKDMPSLNAGGLGLPAIQEPGPHVPDPPLIFAEKEFVFVPVPAETGFGGYWIKDEERTTPNPQPIDVMLGSSKMAMKAHETIPGIWLQDHPSYLTMTAKPRSIPLGPLSRYVETFNKDGSFAYWSMRRDIKVGRSSGQIFFTSCGTMVFRVYARGLWGDAVDYVCEEYSRLEDEGNTIISRQCCKHLASGKTAVQYLVGDYGGLNPPAGYEV